MAQKSVGNYELQHKLGRFSVTSSISPQAKDSSGSSRVRHAVNKLTNEPFCVKYFDKQVLRSHGHSDSFKRDMFLLKSLCGQNPYVSDVLDVFANTSKFFVVMNLAEGGHLCDLSLPFSEPKARYYTRQLIDGVQFLHSHSLFLGDINSENLFLDSQWNLKIRTAKVYGTISGIQSGQQQQQQADPETMCREMSFLAPEILSILSSSQDVSQQAAATASLLANNASVDVWSIGIVCFQLMCGSLPFAVGSQFTDLATFARSLYANIQAQYDPHSCSLSTSPDSDRCIIPVNILTPECVQFLVCLLQLDAASRPHLEAVWDTEWMRSHIVEVPSPRPSRGGGGGGGKNGSVMSQFYNTAPMSVSGLNPAMAMSMSGSSPGQQQAARKSTGAAGSGGGTVRRPSDNSSSTTNISSVSNNSSQVNSQVNSQNNSRVNSQQNSRSNSFNSPPTEDAVAYALNHADAYHATSQSNGAYTPSHVYAHSPQQSPSHQSQSYRQHPLHPPVSPNTANTPPHAQHAPHAHAYSDWEGDTPKQININSRSPNTANAHSGAFVFPNTPPHAPPHPHHGSSNNAFHNPALPSPRSAASSTPPTPASPHVSVHAPVVHSHLPNPLLAHTPPGAASRDSSSFRYPASFSPAPLPLTPRTPGTAQQGHLSTPAQHHAPDGIADPHSRQQLRHSTSATERRPPPPMYDEVVPVPLTSRSLELDSPTYGARSTRSASFSKCNSSRSEGGVTVSSVNAVGGGVGGGLAGGIGRVGRTPSPQLGGATPSPKGPGYYGDIPTDIHIMHDEFNSGNHSFNQHHQPRGYFNDSAPSTPRSLNSGRGGGEGGGDMEFKLPSYQQQQLHQQQQQHYQQHHQQQHMQHPNVTNRTPSFRTNAPSSNEDAAASGSTPTSASPRTSAAWPHDRKDRKPVTTITADPAQRPVRIARVLAPERNRANSLLKQGAGSKDSAEGEDGNNTTKTSVTVSTAASSPPTKTAGNQQQKGKGKEEETKSGGGSKREKGQCVVM